MKLKKYFITGSLIVLPAIITIYLFLWLFGFLDGILGRFINKFLMANFGYSIPGLGIILAIIVIFIVGFAATHLVSKSLMSVFENWFLKLPVIKQVYPAAKQIISFLFTDAKAAFKNVVLVEIPRKGVYSLGFITNEGYKYFEKKVGKDLVNVFIPTTPGPLTGFFVIVPKEEIIFIDISVENALKMIISGGVINPSNNIKA